MTAGERQELVERVARSAIESATGERLAWMHLRANALLEMAPEAHEAIGAGILEAADGGHGMAHAVLSELPDERRRAVLGKAQAFTRYTIRNASEKLVNGAGILGLTPEEIEDWITPEAVVAAAAVQVGDGRR